MNAVGKVGTRQGMQELNASHNWLAGSRGGKAAGRRSASNHDKATHASQSRLVCMGHSRSTAQHSTAQHSTAQHSTAVLSQHQPQPSPVLACVSLLEAKKKVRSSRPERKLAPNVPHPTSAACQSGK